MRSILLNALSGLQCFHVLFLFLHDWIPLGALNDTHAVRQENSPGKVLLASLAMGLPFAYLLFLSWKHVHDRYPASLTFWLAAAYAFLFAGELQSWWVPYFRGADAGTVEKYRAMFGRTHAFLPERNSIRVNTLHVILHGCTVLTLLLLAVAALTGAARV